MLIVALLVPFRWLPKRTGEGARITVAVTPVPVNGKVCGLPVASSAKLTFADLLPVDVGENFTPRLQLAPAARLLAPSGQGVPLVGAPKVNWVGSVPVSVMLVIFSCASPVLLSVTSVVALEVLIVWFPNAMFAGTNPATGTVPVPVSGTVCGLAGASSATLTFALLAPVAVGANFTPTLQLLPADSALAPSGQAVPLDGAPTVNCVGSVPVSVMLVMLSAAVPLFVMVTSVPALVVPVR
jgi:hypothetical protein